VPALPEQIRMRTRAHEFDFVAVIAINQQPIGLEVTFPAATPLAALQGMVVLRRC
jgi:hypothetical protein